MKIQRSHHFWLIMAVFVFCSLLHYVEQIGIGETLAPSLHFGLTRHAFDRIFFLLPVVYSGFVFGLTAGLATCFVALLVMLPRAIFLSPVPQDALLEIGAVLVVSVLACVWFWVRVKDKKEVDAALAELESAHKILQRYVQSARSDERRLTILNAISNVLTESLELEKVFQKATHMVSELMEVEVTLIFSLDEETMELRLVSYEGVSDEFAQAVDRVKIGEGFYGKVARTGQAMIVEDFSYDPRLTRPEVKKMRIQIQLIAPLIQRERIRGIVCVGMRRPRQFHDEEIELLTAVGTQIATAIENAHLYEKERLAAQRLAVLERNYRGLFENANDAIWVNNLEGSIIAANKATEELTGYSVEELTKMGVRDFLLEERLSQARQIRRKLFEKEPVEQPYEQCLIRRDKTEAFVKLTTSLVTEDGKSTGFQHIARDVTEEKRMQENLRYYLQQITKAQEEERKRIAREFHDDTAQALYALIREVDNFIRSNTNLPADYAVFLKDLEERIKEVLQGVRHFSQALRPPMLDDLGLLATLRWLVGELKEQYGVEVDLRVLGIERRLFPETELTLFRIIQEALRNIERHAEASKADVEIEFGEGEIRVSISDNGKGFELSGGLEDLPRTGRLGLAGMGERIHLLGGSMRIQTEPGKGTTIIIEAPV